MREIKKRPFMKKVLSMILSCLLIVSCIAPASVLAATGTVNGVRNYADVYSANGLAYADRESSGVIMWYMNGTSKVSYCVNFGHWCFSDDTFTYPANAYSGFSDEQILWLRAALKYGFTSGWTCSHGTDVNSCTPCAIQYIATQAVIWLISDGEFKNATTAAAWGKHVGEQVTANWWPGIGSTNYDSFIEYYTSLYNSVASVAGLAVGPSFAASASASAPTLTMKWDNYDQEYYVSTTDSNGVLSKFTLSGTPSGVTATKSGNSLSFTGTSSVSKKLLTFSASVDVVTPVWFSPNTTESSDPQWQVQAGAAVTETVKFYTYLATEAPGTLGIIKNESSTGAVITGAEYTIYEDSTCTTAITTVTTGTSYTSTTLAPGTYYVKETKAPTGYALDSTVYTAAVTSGNTTQLTVKDPAWSGTVTVTKTSSTNSSVYVAGAKYGLYSNSACTTLLAEATTNSSGVATFNYSIRYGTTYYVKEISSPDGYDLNTTVYTVAANALTSNGATYNVAAADVPNYDVTTEVVNGTIDDSVYNVSAGGTVMIRYSANSGYVLSSITVDGTAVSISSYKDSYTFSNINANHHIKVVYEKATANITTEVVNGTITGNITDIPLGENRTVESDAKSGYVLQSVTIDGVAVDISTLLASTSYDYTFSNIQGDHHIKVVYVAAGYIQITKTGANSGKPIGSAEYTIYSDSSCTKAVATLVTNASGYAKSAGLAPGTYYVKETKAPVGYELISGYETAKVVGGNTYTLENVNQEPEWLADIEITKTDASGNKLSGATMTVYEWSVSQNKYVELTTMTYSNGAYLALDLPYTDDNTGKFKVIETKNPAGYAGTYEKVFQMDLTQAAGSSQTFTFTDTAVNDTTKYKFTKVDEAGNPIEGCTFYICEGDSYDYYSKVAEWRTDSTGVYVLEGVLEVGKTYTLCEVSRPGGYYGADDITFTVPNSSTVQEYTLVNKSGYRCYITMDKKIKTDDIVWEHGNPTFLFKVAGTDYESVYHEFYSVVSLSEDILTTVEANGYYYNRDTKLYVALDGEYVLLSTYVAVKPGTYVVTEEKTSRYSMEEVVNVANSTVNADGKSATCIMGGKTGADEAEVLFINEKTEQRNYSHSSIVTNRFYLEPAIS